MQKSQAPELTDFNGRRILVTGGTRGIGEAIVERLIRGGGIVIATTRSLPPGGVPDQFIQADVSAREGIEQVVKATMDRLGGLDLLIHNVGGSPAPGGGALNMMFSPSACARALRFLKHLANEGGWNLFFVDCS
jgi:NAD(P)-dependent dehydrogenase (short-subunit alcohol dehydrogenase family)